MPYKNKVKEFHIGSVYHAYNRGYRKSEVYYEAQDYKRFLHFMRIYIDADYLIDDSNIEFNFELNKFEDVYKLKKKVEVLAYCLMPNHFHLLIRLKEKYGMSDLIARISSRYARYFNEKYSQNGRLWADTYKAVEIKDKRHFNTVIKYIHENPLDLGEDITKYPYSSLKYYLKGQSNNSITRGVSLYTRMKLWE